MQYFFPKVYFSLKKVSCIIFLAGPAINLIFFHQRLLFLKDSFLCFILAGPIGPPIKGSEQPNDLCPSPESEGRESRKGFHPGGSTGNHSILCVWIHVGRPNVTSFCFWIRYLIFVLIFVLNFIKIEVCINLG